MTDSIRNNIKMIKKFSKLPQMQLLKSEMDKQIELEKLNTNYTEDSIITTIKLTEYYKKMFSIFPTFAVEFEALFIMVLRDFDLGPLNFMLKTMDQIDNGTISKDKGEMSIGEHLAEKFVKPKKR